MVRQQGLILGQQKKQSSRMRCTQEQIGFLNKKNLTRNYCTARYAERCADCRHARKGLQSRKRRTDVNPRKYARDTEHVKKHLPWSPVTGKLGNSQRWALEGNGANQSPSIRRRKYTKPARIFDRGSSPVGLMRSLKLPTHDEVHPHVAVDLRPKDRIPSNHASEDLKKLLETPRHPPDPGFAMFGVNLSYRHIGDRPPPGLAEKLVDEMEKSHMQSFF